MSKHALTILSHCSLKPGMVAEARKVYESYLALLKMQPECKSVELVCCADDQLVWQEEWASKAAFDNFMQEHLAFSDFVANLYACSRGVPKRQMLQKVH